MEKNKEQKNRIKGEQTHKNKGQSCPRFLKCRTLCFENDETKQFNTSESEYSLIQVKDTSYKNEK